MIEKAFHIQSFPELKNAIMIAGFDGSGNALNVSTGMIDYLNRKLKSEPIAHLNSDLFYRFDQAKPSIEIEDGYLKRITLPGGSISVAKDLDSENDVVILKADEPHLKWVFFAEHLIELCKLIGVRKIATIGSMYDHVLHTDRLISFIATHPHTAQSLKKLEVYPVFYSGPSSIHSIIQAEGKTKGLECVSLWGHCPHYLQDITHFGLIRRMGDILSREFSFSLDLNELDDQWRTMEIKIQALVEKNPELQSVIDDLRRARIRGPWMNQNPSIKKDGKIINLKDFLYSKD